MFYIKDENGKIINYSDDKQPQINFLANIEKDLPILETKENETIVNYQLMTIEEAEQKVQQQEKLRIAKLHLTKREVFLALYDDKSVTPEQIRSQIIDQRALIEFDYANEYYRFNPLIDQIGKVLGYTSDELDYLFEHKEFEKKKPQTTI